MKKSEAKVYRFRLHGHSWMTYIGPVRNKFEAEQELYAQFGSQLCNVRLHPFFTQCSVPENRSRLARQRIV